MAKVKDLKAGVSSGAKVDSVGNSPLANIKAFEVRITPGKVHLALVGTGLMINLEPLMAENIGTNLLRAVEMLRKEKEQEQERMGLILRLPDVKVKMRPEFMSGKPH